MTQNNRIKPTPNQKALLLAEVNCCCPICQKPLIKKQKDRQLNRYEIAHIYPFSPTKVEEKLLEGEERLSDDVNALENLIALCNNCHEDIDNPRTVEGYRKLVSIKKRLLDRTQSKGIYSNPLFEEDIVFVINTLAECSFDELTSLNYDVLSIDSKLQGCQDSIFINKVRVNVTTYYTFIQKLFNDIDKRVTGQFNIIASQVRLFYNAQLQINKEPEMVFNQIVAWIAEKTRCDNMAAIETIVSFFVQDCEVFPIAAK